MDEKYTSFNFSQDSDDKDFREMLDKAIKGDADAMFELGNYYNQVYYTIASSGDDEAYEKAEIFHSKAVYWFIKAAEHGHIYAHCCVGHIYDDVYSVANDFKQAEHWYRKAAELGCDEAQFWLGTIYQKGRGVEENKEIAAYWFTKAAEQGNRLARKYLGECYLNGEGVKQDIKKAVHWFIEAEEKDAHSVWEKLEEIIKEPDAAEKYGFTADMDKINTIIQRGIKDRDDYIKRFEKQRKKKRRNGNNDQKHYDLEEIYANTAKKHKKAAEDGDVYSQYVLGFIYRHGQGVEKNLNLAKEWLETAIKNDSEHTISKYAIKELAELKDEMNI